MIPMAHHTFATFGIPGPDGINTQVLIIAESQLTAPLQCLQRFRIIILVQGISYARS